MCGDNVELAKELERQAISPILEEYDKIINREKPQYTEEELREMFKDVGKIGTQKQETKTTRYNNSVLGHIYTSNCEYVYSGSGDNYNLIIEKCVIPKSLNEYECKENFKEFEQIKKELEAQKEKEEKEKSKTRKRRITKERIC